MCLVVYCGEFRYTTSSFPFSITFVCISRAHVLPPPIVFTVQYMYTVVLRSFTLHAFLPYTCRSCVFVTNCCTALQNEVV